ncbi:XisI protein [Dolichospermum circinale]|uniref:XisI protein n=1 Tax=Dolichospermum circinale TaxID=109265 RepID=UPI0003FC33F6|nr:XisI protein [Dolichospermum circinale]MDB9482614.1 XisI protein [Dolichospermum circinale CS-537/05]MDB9456036.1 XisI protein [Dolichospermum circinale CS-541/06]MDB9461413.1 XisI protein [Dolichospermum circinale CS-541/04]MDB9473938.1 XisI protein [Dolichospermum circinale CS-537/11]MDB9477514.1 XisI protein [Dolichospermum circinale CS-537/03]
MDKVNNYQNIIKQILTEYERISAQVPDPDIDEVLMFDDQRSQYLWFNIGWKNHKRVKAISVYVRIKNEKIYIEEDWTEEGIATELLREGVPKEDIVLAFHDPETRKLTEFAVS